MSRNIRVLIPTVTAENSNRAAVDFLHPNHSVALAIGARRASKGDGIVMGGCGMDMGFALVYALSHALYGRGYQCLGKGKCPSNYHVNHRDTIQCPGTVVYNPDGPNAGEPCRWEREAGAWVIGEGDDEAPYDRVCPTCKGTGRIANPEGPERFDLLHTDGYALRHRWL